MAAPCSPRIADTGRIVGVALKIQLDTVIIRNFNYQNILH